MQGVSVEVEPAEEMQPDAKKLKADDSWIKLDTLCPTGRHSSRQPQLFPLFEPCLTVALDAEDSEDENNQEEFNASTDEVVTAKKLARRSVESDRDQGDIMRVLRRRHASDSSQQQRSKKLREELYTVLYCQLLLTENV